MRSQPTFSASLSLRRLRRISRWMALSCWALMTVLPLALVFFWATASEATLAEHVNLRAQAIQGPLQAWQRSAAAAATAVPLGLLMTGLWQARRCFSMFARGEVFTSQTAALLGRFAGWVAWAAGASLLAGMVCSVLLTLNNPPGMRHLAFGIGSSQLFTLFFAGTVWLMSAVIAQGRGLAEENQGFV